MFLWHTRPTCSPRSICGHKGSSHFLPILSFDIYHALGSVLAQVTDLPEFAYSLACALPSGVMRKTDISLWRDSKLAFLFFCSWHIYNLLAFPRSFCGHKGLSYLSPLLTFVCSRALGSALSQFADFSGFFYSRSPASRSRVKPRN